MKKYVYLLAKTRAFDKMFVNAIEESAKNRPEHIPVFPGNPTKLYRLKQLLKIVAEVIKWEGHSPDLLNNMLENLRKLSEQGIKVID